jgi:hypothetical protein
MERFWAPIPEEWEGRGDYGMLPHRQNCAILIPSPLATTADRLNHMTIIITTEIAKDGGTA